MPDTNPDQQFDFEQIDADAVCEHCGTVNPDATLICKTCGNNLRDQRMRRITGEQVAAVGAPGANRVRVFTGILTGLGIITILAAVLNLDNIEAWLVSAQVAEEPSGLGNVWSGPGSELYNQLARELEENPVTGAERRDAISNPVIDVAYNGRYVLSRPDPLSGRVILGYANLSRRGDRIHFVANLNYRDVQIRGFAMLSSQEGEEPRPVAMNSASFRIGGQEYIGWGYAVRNPEGSHTVYAQSSFNDKSYGILAHRIR